MRTEDAGPVRLGRHLAEGGEELLFGGGDECRQEGRDAGLEKGVSGMAVAVAVGGQEVDTGESVHLQVDEPGHGDPAAVRCCQSEPGHPTAEDLDVALHESAVDEGRFDAEPHGALSSARAMLRPDWSRRSRAFSASIPARSDTMATRASPFGCCESVVDLGARSTARGGDDPPHAIVELVVRGRDVDHEVPVGLAESDHRDGRDRVEDELLRRARFEARGSCEELGPDDDGDLVVDDRAELGVRRGNHACGERTGARGGVERTEHVRRGTARADAHDGVDGAELERRDLVDAASAVVFGSGLDER